MDGAMKKNQKLAGITGSKAQIEEMKQGGPHEDPMKVNFKKVINKICG
jgi:hypothetical protein